MPSFQYLVIEPRPLPHLTDLMYELLLSPELKKVESSGINLQHKVINDPFNNIPFDVLHTLLSHIPGESLRSLVRASWPVYSATRYQGFWKNFIHWDMPWFWEFRELALDPNRTDLDYKTAYLYLDHATTPTYGMEGQFMAIANRRRIWTPCQQLANLYFQRKSRTSFIKTNEQSASILKRSECMNMPVVMCPQPKDAPTITKQWICSWDEMESKASTFETFWNPAGALVGLGITFGASWRVFGRTATNEPGKERITGISRRIEENNWITALTLHIPDMDLLEKDPRTAVGGVTVRTFKGLRRRSREKRAQFPYLN
jgi:hypothetical protein